MARRNLTHEGLALALDDVGVKRSREAITAWVAGRGEPDLDLLPKVAQALKVPIADLIEGYHDQPGPTPEEVMAEKVAARVVDLLREQNGAGDSSSGWVEEFLRQINIQRAIEAAATAIHPSQLGDQRYVREAAAEIQPMLESVARAVAQDVAEQIAEWRLKKKRGR